MIDYVEGKLRKMYYKAESQEILEYRKLDGSPTKICHTKKKTKT